MYGTYIQYLILFTQHNRRRYISTYVCAYAQYVQAISSFSDVRTDSCFFNTCDLSPSPAGWYDALQDCINLRIHSCMFLMHSQAGSPPQSSSSRYLQEHTCTTQCISDVTSINFYMFTTAPPHIPKGHDACERTHLINFFCSSKGAGSCSSFLLSCTRTSSICSSTLSRTETKAAKIDHEVTIMLDYHLITCVHTYMCHSAGAKVGWIKEYRGLTFPM